MTVLSGLEELQRVSVLSVCMEPETENCEMASASKDSWAKQTSQRSWKTQYQLFSGEADRHRSSFTTALWKLCSVASAYMSVTYLNMKSIDEAPNYTIHQKSFMQCRPN